VPPAYRLPAGLCKSYTTKTQRKTRNTQSYPLSLPALSQFTLGLSKWSVEMQCIAMHWACRGELSRTEDAKLHKSKNSTSKKRN